MHHARRITYTPAPKPCHDIALVLFFSHTSGFIQSETAQKSHFQ
jgi:hypothetical protein